MNYYEILKVPENATNTEIKNSYKLLVKKYHPDLYMGDKDFAEQKIKQINEAYNILSTPETRAEYDEYLNTKNSETYSTEYENNSESTSASYTENPTNETDETSSLSKFLISKFNLLSKKRQLQIIILIVIIILGLILINLIQMQYFLSNMQNYDNDYDDYYNHYDGDKDDYEEYFDYEEYLFNLLDKYEQNKT